MGRSLLGLVVGLTLAAWLIPTPAHAEAYEVGSPSTFKQCFERLPARRTCVVTTEAVKRTIGTAEITSGIYSATLPTVEAVDIELKFERPGCLIWNHRASFPGTGEPGNTASAVQIVRITAPVGTVAGSRIRIVDPCIEEWRNGARGGNAATVVQGLVFEGPGAANVDVQIVGDTNITLASTGSGTTEKAGRMPRSGVDAYGLRDGAFATPATLDYIDQMQTFEGLSSGIISTHCWIDPYTGSDSNDCLTDSAPIRTIGKAKQLITEGWAIVADNRDGRRIFSPQTFGYTATSGTCTIGESVTYGGNTATVLDIHTSSKTIVLRTDVGDTPAVATDDITGGTSGCVWDLTTHRPTIFDGTTFVCELGPTTEVTLGAGCTRGQSGSCTTPCAGEPGSTAVAASNAFIQFGTVDESLDGRIVALFTRASLASEIVVDGNHRPLGWVADGSAPDDGSDDDDGLFIHGGQPVASTTYGALGVEGWQANYVQNDIVSQHGEGIVKTLNVTCYGVENTTSDTNNNCYTTHNGGLGRGGIITLNAAATGFPATSAGGSALAPTGYSYSIHLANEPSTHKILADISAQADASTKTPFGGSGGDVVIIGHEFGCVNWVSGNGCHGGSFAPVTASKGRIQIARSKFSFNTSSSLGALRITSISTIPTTARIYNSVFVGGRAIYLQAVTAAPIDLLLSGVAFHSNTGFDIYDLSTSSAFISPAIFEGVWDEVAGVRFFANGANRTNLSDLVASATTWDLFTSRSREADASLITSGELIPCTPGEPCATPMSRDATIEFPVPIYDVLPTALVGYIEPAAPDFGAHVVE